MIVANIKSPCGEKRLQMITQNDHAHFAAELLKLWSCDGLRDHPRRDSLLFAARQHDSGWLETDAAPPCDAAGRPHDFLSIPLALRQEIWHRCTTRYADRDPYANLLIVEHALHLHRTRADDPQWAELLAHWHQLRLELQEQTAIDDEALADDYRWIDLTDHLSLVVCNRWTQPIDERGYRARFVGHALQLEPFPLVGQTTFRVPYREIADRSYAGVVDLGGELAMARWQELEIQVAPWLEI